MNILEKKNFYNSLFDYYGKLLTPKQQLYFKNYYFEDLSLSEIANMHNVSRNAIFDQLNKIYQILENYENKLGLFHKNIARNQIYEQYSESNNPVLINLITKLKNLE